MPGLDAPPTRQWPQDGFDAEDLLHPTTLVTRHAPNRPTRLREVRGQTATSPPLRTTSGGELAMNAAGKHSPNISDKSNNVSALLEDTPTSTARKALQDNVLRLLTCPMGCRLFHNHSQWVCVRFVSDSGVLPLSSSNVPPGGRTANATQNPAEAMPPRRPATNQAVSNGST